MKNSRAIVVLFVSFGLVCLHTSPAVNFSYRSPDLCKVLAASALIGGGLAMLSLLDEPRINDDLQWSSSQQLKDDVVATYSNMFRIIDKEIATWQYDLSTASESVLYRIAVAKRNAASITIYLNKLEQCITKLKKVKPSPLSVIDQLLRLRDLLSLHRDYFELYEVENAIWQEFKQELALLYDASISYYILENQLHSTVHRLCNSSWESYPHVSYVSRVRKALDRLEQTIDTTPLCYYDRVGAARELLSKLYSLEAIMLDEPHYTYELALKY